MNQPVAFVPGIRKGMEDIEQGVEYNIEGQYCVQVVMLDY